VTESARAIFLSYASQDAAAARAIGDALRAAGLEVWFDQSQLRGGDVWDEMIRRQIAECALFIPVISGNTASRLEGYFRLEWSLADQRTQRMSRNKPFIVPVCIDATPESGADVPESFVRVQWSRLQGGPTPPAFAERIAGLLDAGKSRTTTIAATASPTPLPAVSPAATAGPAPRPNRLILVGTAVVLCVLAAGVWLATRPVVTAAPPQMPVVPPVSAPGATAGAPGIPEKSIAVLPFVDMSEKKDQEYFSDGLSEELLDLLAQVPDLHVAARTSSFYFKNKAEDIATIGQKLRVAHVLEGSVRKAGSKIRVTAQLIRVDNGYHIWSKTYDRDVRDIFMVQDEISNAVVDALKVQLLSNRPMVSRHQTENTEAYNDFLWGNQLRLIDDPASNAKARASYQKAVALDPRYAAAYSALSEVEWRIADQSTNEPQGYARAAAAADKAVTLAPDAPEGYWARGQLRFGFYFDWAGAKADLEKATTLDPAFEPAALELASLQATLGHGSEAIENLRKIASRDTLSTRAWRALGRSLLDSGKYDEAREVIERIRAIGTNPVAFRFSGQLELFLGNPAAALEQFRKDPGDFWRLQGIAMAEHDLGHPAESQTALKEAMQLAGDAESYQYAQVYAYKNDKNEAFRWLDRAFQLRDGGLVHLKYDSFMKNLRGDPRYAALLDKMHLPPE
jgi:TolB-like protein